MAKWRNEKTELTNKKPDGKDALKIIKKHFAEVTTSQFLRNLKKHCPEFLESLSKTQVK